MLNNLIAKLTNRQQEREQTAAESYRDLVASIADGEAPTVDAIETVLSAAGKSVEDLQSDVDLRLRRAEWQTTVAGETELKQRREDLLAAKEQAKSQFQKTKAEFDRLLDGRNEELAEVDQGLRACDEARRQLAVTAPADVLAAQRELPTKAVYERLESAKRHLRHESATLAGLRDEYDLGGRPATMASKVQSQESAVDDAKADVEQLEAELAELHDESTRLADAALTAV